MAYFVTIALHPINAEYTFILSANETFIKTDQTLCHKVSIKVLKSYQVCSPNTEVKLETSLTKINKNSKMFEKETILKTLGITDAHYNFSFFVNGSQVLTKAHLQAVAPP